MDKHDIADAPDGKCNAIAIDPITGFGERCCVPAAVTIPSVRCAACHARELETCRKYGVGR